MNIINQITKIVLTAGHGGTDSGAYDPVNKRAERDNNTYITKKIYEYSKQFPIPNLEFELWDEENKYALADEIKLLNKKYPFFWTQNKILITSFHQDMYAPHLDINRQKWQFGAYYFQNDTGSKETAYNFREAFVKFGAYEATPENKKDYLGSWYKDHYLEDRKFFLGFIHHIKAFSMIFELGYISANHTKEELDKLAFIWYKSLYYLRTNIELTNVIKQQVVDNIIINNTNNNKNMELKNKIINEIQNENYNEEIKNELIKATNEENFDFLLDNSGARVRDLLTNEQNKNKKLQETLTKINIEKDNLYSAYLQLQEQYKNDLNYYSNNNNNNNLNNTKTNNELNIQNRIKEIFNVNDDNFIRHMHSTVNAIIIASITFIINIINQKTGYNISIELFNSIININEIVDTITYVISSVFIYISSNNLFSTIQDYMRNKKNEN